MFKEFKEFAMRGNVLDLAIGVILGAAFGKIVSSFVNDILMPPISLLLGNVDFSNLFIALSGGSYATLAQAEEAGAITLNYGLFINMVVDFILVAFVIFLMVRQINRMLREEESPPPPPSTKECPFCISTIAIQATRCPNCTSELSS